MKNSRKIAKTNVSSSVKSTSSLRSENSPGTYHDLHGTNVESTNAMCSLFLLSEIKTIRETMKLCQDNGEDVTGWNEIIDIKMSEYRARCGLPPRPCDRPPRPPSTNL